MLNFHRKWEIEEGEIRPLVARFDPGDPDLTAGTQIFTQGPRFDPKGPELKIKAYYIKVIKFRKSRN